MVSEYNLTTNVIVTAVLHDVVEDSEATVGMIVDAFSRRIAEMVDRLTRDRPDGSKLSVETILNNAYEKNDKEVLLIKVIDRLHNLSTISHLEEKKIIQQKQETINARFIGIAAIISINLEEALFLKTQQNKSSNTHRNNYNTKYSLSDEDFQLARIEH